MGEILYEKNSNYPGRWKSERKHYPVGKQFSECDEGIKFVKPEYDNYCYGLVQPVLKLENNREAIWHEFSDI